MEQEEKYLLEVLQSFGFRKYDTKQLDALNVHKELATNPYQLSLLNQEAWQLYNRSLVHFRIGVLGLADHKHVKVHVTAFYHDQILDVFIGGVNMEDPTKSVEDLFKRFGTTLVQIEPANMLDDQVLNLQSDELQLLNVIYILSDAYYNMPNNSAGGYLHIVLDDGNTDDGCIKSCEDLCLKQGDKMGLLLCSLLLMIPEVYRDEVLDNRWKYLPLIEKEYIRLSELPFPN